MFKSFFFAGFECTAAFNVHRRWIDQVVATQHDLHALQDYQLLRETGLHAARDGVRWPVVDQGGSYDFSTVEPLLDASQENGIEVIWDLFHFGYPSRLDPFSPDFAKHFADYCFAVGHFLRERTDGPLYITPVNEPSYFAWAGGEVGKFAPHARHRGEALKIALVQAALRGTEALWEACPGVSIITVDPICRVVPPARRPELQAEADHFNERIVFESLDMLSGRLRPELGGSRRHLGIVGINYYANNQWELRRTGSALAPDDPRRWPLREIVRNVWKRYGGDILITETSHSDDMRPVWLRDITEEAVAMLDEGIPLKGICLYPILGMPEWHAPRDWARMGLWDLRPRHDPHGSPGSVVLHREPHGPSLHALREAARRLEERGQSQAS